MEPPAVQGAGLGGSLDADHKLHAPELFLDRADSASAESGRADEVGVSRDKASGRLSSEWGGMDW